MTSQQTADRSSGDFSRQGDIGGEVEAGAVPAQCLDDRPSPNVPIWDQERELDAPHPPPPPPAPPTPPHPGWPPPTGGGENHGQCAKNPSSISRR